MTEKMSFQYDVASSYYAAPIPQFLNHHFSDNLRPLIFFYGDIYNPEYIPPNPASLGELQQCIVD